MRFIYATNIWSHHQAPVATELARILGATAFRMAIFDDVHPHRSAMGWADAFASPFVIGPPQDPIEKGALYRECIKAEVLVIGDCHPEIVSARTAANRLTFIASERMLKKQYHRMRLANPRYALGFRRFRQLVNHPCVHALGIGYYASDDLRALGAFGDRVWRWGYFVDVSPQLPPACPPGQVRILWVGRMLNWKRADVLLHAVALLARKNLDFVLTLVGDGPEKARLLQMARKFRLDERRLRFHPPVPFAQIREFMRGSEICVLASNRQEGWGAVAGEAMSEGCVLVANEQAGAARELVTDGETGLLFRDGDIRDLAGKLETLCGDLPLRMRLRRNAWERMQIWHPRVAAERLVALSSGILSGLPPHYSSGPCSPCRV